MRSQVPGQFWDSQDHQIPSSNCYNPTKRIRGHGGKVMEYIKGHQLNLVEGAFKTGIISACSRCHIVANGC